MREFLPLNRLEDLLIRATTDPVVRPDFYRELLATDIFFATPAPPAGASRVVLEVGSDISFVGWEAPSGHYTACFTARERLEQIFRSSSPIGFLAIRGREAFELLAQGPDGAILNPGLPYGLEMPLAEVRRIADGTIFGHEPIRIEQDTQVMIGDPAVYPTELVAALTRCFATRPNVAKAYLAHIYFPKSPDPPHPVVGVESTVYVDDIREAGLVAREVAHGAYLVDFIEIHADPDGGVADYFREKAPFYERGRRS